MPQNHRGKQRAHSSCSSGSRSPRTGHHRCVKGDSATVGAGREGSCQTDAPGEASSAGALQGSQLHVPWRACPMATHCASDTRDIRCVSSLAAFHASSSSKRAIPVLSPYLWMLDLGRCTLDLSCRRDEQRPAHASSPRGRWNQTNSFYEKL